MTLLENLLVALVGPNESVRSPRAPHPDRFLIACALPDRTFSMSFFMDKDQVVVLWGEGPIWAERLQYQSRKQQRR